MCLKFYLYLLGTAVSLYIFQLNKILYQKILARKKFIIFNTTTIFTSPGIILLFVILYGLHIVRVYYYLFFILIN